MRIASVGNLHMRESTTAGPLAALLLAVLASTGSSALAADAKPPPTDAQCNRLPPPRGAAAFAPGERLSFDLDALGAKAGSMTLRTLQPDTQGQLPVEFTAQTSPFFSNIRRVKGNALSYLNPKTLRPTRYVENSVENETKRSAEALFHEGALRSTFRIDDKPGRRDFRTTRDTLDNLGAIYLLRQLPLSKGMPICFDAFGIRRLWRVSAKVLGREHVKIALGEFEAWHISGEAVRLDDNHQRREIHLWITDDARRLPVVAVGSLDFGAIRATLTAVARPGEKPGRAPGAQSLTW